MFPKNLRPLLPYLKRYRWGFVAGVFCIFLSNGAWVLLPQVIRHAVDDLNTGVTSAKLLHFAWQMLEVASVRGIFLFLTRWIVIGISRDIEFDLRTTCSRTWKRFPTPITSACVPATSWPG